MSALLIFAVVLTIAVLLSDLANRSVLSTAVLFLVAGFVCGRETLGWLPLSAASPVVSILAELALFSVLFTDGMRVGARDLLRAWHLPGRALLLGLPLTLLFTALLAHWVAGLSWQSAFLVGAVLSPTDPVFAAAIVGRKEIPARLRNLLNVESGLNDGLALPIVLVLMAMAAGTPVSGSGLGIEIGAGVLLGIAVPWIGAKIEQSRFFAIAQSYEPLYAFSLGLLVFALAGMTHANVYLAAFAAGVTVVTVSTRLRDEFHRFGETVAELFKLAALLVFGALMSPTLMRDLPWSGYLFALLALFVARPVALGLSLVGSELDLRERVAAAWFGPKGFASVVYGLLLLNAGLPGAGRMFHLIALVIAGSILAHSSTDVVIARWFRNEEAAPA
ncbi:MAG: cation:proton antiporter [Chthoniobacterales bacterium]